MPNQDVQDGNLDFSGGQDGSQDAASTPPNAYFAGINISTADGNLTSRWGIKEINLAYEFTTSFRLPTGLLRSYESIFESGRFQAIIPYIVGQEYFLIIVIAGAIFAVNQNTFEVNLISIEDGSTLSESHPRVNWSYIKGGVVLFDFPAFPVILEGFVAKRSDPSKLEIPVSNLGTYNQFRLMIANAGTEFTASDPDAYGFEPLGSKGFTEVEQLASPYFGQIFQLPTENNNEPISAMGFLQVIDTSTGIGPLLVATQSKIYSYRTDLLRSQWEQTQFGSLFVANAGIAGQRAFTNVNSDLFFIDSQGQLRSASMSRDEQGKWSKTPISREVKRWLKLSSSELNSYCAITYFKNKVILTANPFRVSTTTNDLTPIFDVAFGGFAVMEMDNISTLLKGASPVWSGLWTGIRPMDLCINNDRLFVIGKDGGKNKLYEIDPKLTYDVIGTEQKIRKIRSKVYTRQYDFQTPFKDKTLNSIELALFDVKGKFKLNISYKPSHGTKFIKWREFEHDAPWQSCRIPQGCEWNGLEGHNFKDLNLGSPDDSGENPVTKEKLDTFRRVEILLEIEGIHWEIQEFILNAEVIPQNTTENVAGKAYPDNIKICAECNTDWEIPDICQENPEIP